MRRLGARQVRRGFGQVCSHQIVGLRFKRDLLLLQKGLRGVELVDRVSVENALAGQGVEGSAELVGRSFGIGRRTCCRGCDQLLQRAEDVPRGILEQLAARQVGLQVQAVCDLDRVGSAVAVV